MATSLTNLTAYLPDGLLPKWLLFISIVSIGNSLSSYASTAGASEVYAGSPGQSSPTTPLSSRTFGTWTALSSIIRLYAAYNIRNPAIYQMALWTFALALAHFASEWLIFGTARWGRGLAGPLFVATLSSVWMFTQWREYVVE